MSGETKTRILIVDDHELMRAGLMMLIDSEPSMAVVGEASNCAAAVELARSTQPDIILLDVDLSGSNGIDCIPDLIAASGSGRVLMLTGMQDREEHQRAARLGARGLVMKEQAVATLLKAIDKVRAGEVWFDRALISQLLSTMSGSATTQKADRERAKIASLTEREHEIIALISEGLPNKAIADRLSLSETTVRHHLTSIFTKLDLDSRLELVIFAYNSGLASPKK